MRAGIYTRLSVDRDGSKEGPQRQEADCRRRCKAEGWKVVDVYCDRDVSAFKRNAKRPEFERLLSDLREGLLDVVLVWKIDRFTRQGIRAVGTILDALEVGGGRLVSATEGFDSSTMQGEIMLGVLASVAKAESENISARVSRAALSTAERGGFNRGGHRLFGYNRDGSISDREAQDLRLMASLVTNGQSLRYIARFLNQTGSRTTAGNEWQPSSVGQTLRSARLRGVREHQGRFYRGEWAPIFTESEHLEVLRVLNDPDRRTRKPQHNTRYLLSGIARCGRCGEKMYLGKQGTPNGEGFIKYACKRLPGKASCGSVTVTQPSTDEFVRRALIDRLRAAALDASADRPADAEVELSELQERIAADKDAIETLADDLYVHRTIERETYMRVRLELEDRVAKSEAELIAASAPRRRLDWTEGSPDPDLTWKAMSVEERRAVLDDVVERLVVHPAKRRGGNQFDSERIQIVWR